MGTINSKSAARRRVREAQLRANEARVECERQNVDDAASLLVELGRLAAVEEWEATRILEIRAEAERRRNTHRQAGGIAVARMQGRGESLAAIAELAGVKVGSVRMMLKAASAHTGAAVQALGEGNGAAAPGAAPLALGANGVTAHDDGAAAQALGANGAAAHDEGVGGRV